MTIFRQYNISFFTEMVLCLLLVFSFFIGGYSLVLELQGKVEMTADEIHFDQVIRIAEIYVTDTQPEFIWDQEKNVLFIDVSLNSLNEAGYLSEDNSTSMFKFESKKWTYSHNSFVRVIQKKGVYDYQLRLCYKGINVCTKDVAYYDTTLF